MKKFRHLWLSILTLILSVSIIIGGAGLSAFAAADSATIIGGEEFATPVVLPSTAELGTTVKVRTDAIVTAPNGTPVELEGTDKEFTAAMLGNYEIKYKNDSQTYTHTVNVKLTNEYELRVAGDGAGIPTYTDTEKPYTLPKAYLYVKADGEDEFVPAEEKKIAYSYKVLINGNEVNDKEPQKFTAGRNSVQYVAQLTGVDKYFTKQYDVNAQTSFSDTVRPTIAISGVPTDASLKTKVTLPKATATDNYDSNVKINVTVKLNNEDVLEVELDDYGYAEKYKTDDDSKNIKVEFDNVYNMSFYPMEIGTYVVEYEAEDDAGNKSVKQPFNIKVQDRTAPVLESIADDQIPTTWGLDVVNKEDENGSSKSITFPYPEYSDNSGKDGISVSFEIRDTVNNYTVIRFENIYATEGNGNKYEYVSTDSSKRYVTDKTEEFTEKGFEFNFENYKVDGKTPTGTYTAIYNARDAKPNSTTKSYDISLQETFTDKVEPSVTIDADSYLYISGTPVKYTLPMAEISDAIDSRPTVEYKVVGGKLEGTTFAAANEGLTVKNGEEISVKVVGDNVVVSCEGKEDYTFAYAEYKILRLAVTATDDAGNPKEETADIKLVVGDEFEDVVLEIKEKASTSTNALKANQKANLGSFTVGAFNKAYKDYVGFEMYLTNPNGEIVNGVDFETYVSGDDSKKQINIDNVTFVPSMDTEGANKPKYILTIRAFDITGRSTVVAYSYDIAENTNSGQHIERAAAIPTSGKVNVSYKLKNQTFNNATNLDEERAYIVSKISNTGRFSLMGSEFTAYTTGTVSFTDGYYKEEATELTPIGSTYFFTADDNSNPVFELLGPAPVQKEKIADENKNSKDKWVDFPQIVAYNEYANAKISVNVTDPNGKTYKWIADADHTSVANKIDFTDNVLKFCNDIDGEYTVEFIASVGASEEVKQSFKVRVGDTVPPVFTVSGNEYSATARQNSTFTFKKVALDSGETDKIADITFTKRLLDPSGNEVFSTSEKGQTGADKAAPSSGENYTFTMTGTYTVEYTVTDKAGNSSVYQDTINVSATETSNAMPLKVLRTVLIIVGVILIAGVILYFVRFRKVKAD